VLVNPATTNTEAAMKDVKVAAGALGLQIHVLNATTNREIDAAFATFARDGLQALFRWRQRPLLHQPAGATCQLSGTTFGPNDIRYP
jgi:hypothetical protein